MIPLLSTSSRLRSGARPMWWYSFGWVLLERRFAAACNGGLLRWCPGFG